MPRVKEKTSSPKKHRYRTRAANQRNKTPPNSKVKSRHGEVVVDLDIPQPTLEKMQEIQYLLESVPDRNPQGGRPSLYCKEYAEIAEIAIKEFGCSIDQLGKLLNKGVTTINRWRREHPEFKEAIQAGLDEFNTKRIEATCLQRAMGYEYEETRTETIQVKGTAVLKVLQRYGLSRSMLSENQINTLLHEEVISGRKITKYNKTMAPDPTLIMFWLQNRAGHRWRNVKHLKANFTANKKQVDKIKRNMTPEEALQAYQSMITVEEDSDE